MSARGCGLFALNIVLKLAIWGFAWYCTCMKNALQNLPSDSMILHQIIGDLTAQNDNLTTQVGDLSAQIKFLKEQLGLVKAKQYGQSSEKVDRQLDLLELQVEEIEQTSLVPIEEVEVVEGKRQAKRIKIAESLERINITLNPESTCPKCGGEEFRKISDDISETLEYIPSSFKVKRYIRPRCACVNCEAIVQAYPASKPIAKGKAGPSLLAHIIIQKYCNHLPLYRQSQIYAREGVEIPRSTMASWVGECARLLDPVITEIKNSIFKSGHIFGDDTPVKVLAPGLGRTKTGRLWVYAKDGRPHGDVTPPAVCYFYSPDRKSERPQGHLKDFKGVLHADAYAGYDKLYESGDITEAACWAHMRRKFYEVTVASDNASIATQALEEIGAIYDIEAKIKGSDPGQRLDERQRLSRPLVEKFFSWLNKAYKELPRKSMTAQAITYALNQQEALQRFLADGKIEIDNNIAERAVRGIAIGRKNWLFAGSDNGGESAAIFYTLIETAKLNNLNPWLYLQTVLDRIQDQHASKISELLPWNIILPTLSD
jgi:transposase